MMNKKNKKQSMGMMKNQTMMMEGKGSTSQKGRKGGKMKKGKRYA